MRHFNPPPSCRDPRWAMVREALLVLGTVASEDLDYAKQQNGVGFSKSDSTKGHGLARLSPSEVLRSSATYAEVLKMAARYRRQASRIGQGNLF